MNTETFTSSPNTNNATIKPDRLDVLRVTLPAGEYWLAVTKSGVGLYARDGENDYPGQLIIEIRPSVL